MKTWILVYLIVSTVFALPSQQIFADHEVTPDITWTGGGGDSDWSNIDNWDLGREPVPGENIFIPFVASNPFVNMTANFAVDGFLEIDPGATLNVNDGVELQINNELLGNGILVNDGNVTINGVADVDIFLNKDWISNFADFTVRAQFDNIGTMKNEVGAAFNNDNNSISNNFGLVVNLETLNNYNIYNNFGSQSQQMFEVELPLL